MCDNLDVEGKERCGTEWPELKYSEWGHVP
jgi:hypothetical protein